jgi:sec-independent protein translocase protein TatA
MIGAMSLWHWAIVVGVVTILFGKNKISGIMSDLGGGLREFKRGLHEAASTDEEVRKAVAHKSEEIEDA